MTEKTDQRIIAFAIAALGLFFIYGVYRAFHLSLTHDEALTYIYFAKLPKTYSELFAYQIPTTNNHLLNSVLIKFFTSFLGDSELVIRIPTLIGYALYLIGIFLIIWKTFDKWFLLLTTPLLALHPFLIDYFTCARGYGLGLGFMMISIYFTLQACQNLINKGPSPNYFLSSFAACALMFISILGNLIFINVFLSLCTWMLVSALIFGRFDSIKNYITKSVISASASLLFICLGLWVYWEPIRKLRNANEFYYGGNDGLWKDVVQTLVSATVHEKYSNSPLPALFLNVLILFCVLFAAIEFFRKRNEWRRDLSNQNLLRLISLSLIFLSLTSIELQRVIFKNVYPYDRGVIYLIPLFSILFLTLDITVFKINLKWALSILLCIHYFFCINATHFLKNKPDAHTKEMIAYIQEINRDKLIAPNSLKFGIHWWFEPAINYYILKNQIPWFGFVTREGFDGHYSYYYVREEDKWVIEKYKLKILKHYDISDTYLAVPENS